MDLRVILSFFLAYLKAQPPNYINIWRKGRTAKTCTPSGRYHFLIEKYKNWVVIFLTLLRWTTCFWEKKRCNEDFNCLAFPLFPMGKLHWTSAFVVNTYYLKQWICGNKKEKNSEKLILHNFYFLHLNKGATKRGGEVKIAACSLKPC